MWQDSGEAENYLFVLRYSFIDIYVWGNALTMIKNSVLFLCFAVMYGTA